MRILFLNAIGRIGGAERVLLDLISATRQAHPEWDLHLLSLEDGPLLDASRQLGVTTDVVPTSQSFFSLGDSGAAGRFVSLAARSLAAAPAIWRSARALRDFVTRTQPDVIHSNSLKTHLLHAIAVKQVPTVWHIHDFVGARPLIVKALRLLSKGVTPIAISRAVADDVTRWLDGKPAAARIQVIKNGIDLDRFSPGPANPADVLDQAAGFPPSTGNTMRVGIVATYARWKGQDVFLRAAAKIAHEWRDPSAVRFYVVGGPIYSTRGSQFSRAELVALAADLKLQDNVGFIDFRPDTEMIYRSLDIVVHASTKPEPFGLTIAEAMACGRPMIVSAAGGAASLFRNGEDAVGVPPGNVQALAEAIARVAGDAPLRTSLAQTTRQSALKDFDRRRMAAEFAQVYGSLCGRRD